MKFRHTVMTIIAVIALFGPLALDILGRLPWPWAKSVGGGVAVVLAFLADKQRVALLGRLFGGLDEASDPKAIPKVEEPPK